MNLCIDCIHFRHVKAPESKGTCHHPRSVISQSPIDGDVAYNTAENMRGRITRCGAAGVLFHPNESRPVIVDSDT